MTSIGQLRKMLREGNFNGASKPESKPELTAREKPSRGSGAIKAKDVENTFGVDEPAPGPREARPRSKGARPARAGDRFGKIKKRIVMETLGAPSKRTGLRHPKMYVLTMYETTVNSAMGLMKYDVVAKYGRKGKALKQFIIARGVSGAHARRKWQEKLNEKIDKGYTVLEMKGVS